MTVAVAAFLPGSEHVGSRVVPALGVAGKGPSEKGHQTGAHRRVEVGRLDRGLFPQDRRVRQAVAVDRGVTGGHLEQDNSRGVALGGRVEPVALAAEEGVEVGRWLPWTLLLLVPIVWFGGLAAAALTGRRNPEGLWVVDDDLVHESGWGREQTPLAGCSAVTVSGTVLVLVFAEPTQRTICPRPWRPPLPASGEMRVETAALAVPAAELGRWLAPALPDDCDVRLGE